MVSQQDFWAKTSLIVEIGADLGDVTMFEP